MALIGIDLGGTKLAGAVFSPEGRLAHRTLLPLEKKGGVEVGHLIKTLLKTLLEAANEDQITIKAIGVSVPGISYRKTGNVWAPNIPGWENYPLHKEIVSVVANNNVQITIDSDRACYILGEHWQGAAQECQDAIFLAVGTGIGAGILINGEILRGANDIAGAIGWLALERPFLERYGSCGCFESHASGEGIAKVATDFLSREKGYQGTLRNIPLQTLTSHDVFEAYKSQDPIAAKVLHQAIEYWGMAAANLVSLFNPEKIIFGGGVFGPALQFLDTIHAEAKKWAQPVSIGQVKLEAAKLGGDAGLYGAGYLALRTLKD